MKHVRMAIEEMEQKYPNEYLFITNCVHDEHSTLIEGIVAVHSPSIEDVYAELPKHTGHVAIRYTGELFPEGAVML